MADFLGLSANHGRLETPSRIEKKSDRIAKSLRRNISEQKRKKKTFPMLCPVNRVLRFVFQPVVSLVWCPFIFSSRAARPRPQLNLGGCYGTTILHHQSIPPLRSTVLSVKSRTRKGEKQKKFRF